MELLDNINHVGSIDKSNMLNFLSDFHKQCGQAVNIAKSVELPERYKNFNFDNILFVGMGGSAIGAHFLLCYLRDELNMPAVVNRDYTIPGFVSKNTLVVCCSYSGNTVETINAYQRAKKRTSKIIVITSDGKLLEKSDEDGFLHIRIPSGYPPRTAFGFSFFSLLLLCSKVGLIGLKKDEVKETIRLLKDMSVNRLGLDIKSKSNLAKQIAYECHEKFPVIYGAYSYLDAVVLRWRTQLAENSKMLSSTNVFPEMNHNEIVGWKFPESLLPKFVGLILRDKSEHQQVSKRIEITNDILENENFKIIKIDSLGDSFLARLFSLIYIGDFVSFYLAILNNVDPTPVKRITYLKNKLAKI